MEKVKVILRISGDYCAFHEMTFKVEYDITNNIQLGNKTLVELEKLLQEDEERDYSDYDIVDAILDGKKYYVNL